MDRRGSRRDKDVAFAHGSSGVPREWAAGPGRAGINQMVRVVKLGSSSPDEIAATDEEGEIVAVGPGARDESGKPLGVLLDKTTARGDAQVEIGGHREGAAGGDHHVLGEAAVDVDAEQLAVPRLAESAEMVEDRLEQEVRPLFEEPPVLRNALPDRIDALEQERAALFVSLSDPQFLRDGALQWISCGAHGVTKRNAGPAASR